MVTHRWQVTKCVYINWHYWFLLLKHNCFLRTALFPVTAFHLTTFLLERITFTKRGLERITVTKRGLERITVAKRALERITVTKRGLECITVAKRGLEHSVAKRGFTVHTLAICSEMYYSKNFLHKRTTTNFVQKRMPNFLESHWRYWTCHVNLHLNAYT